MRRILKILILSSFFINLAAGLFGPIYAIFVEEIGGDLLTAGTAYAIFAIASGSLIFMLGKWEDKVKHQEKLLVFGRFLAVIGFIFPQLGNGDDGYAGILQQLVNNFSQADIAVLDGRGERTGFR